MICGYSSKNNFILIVYLNELWWNHQWIYLILWKLVGYFHLFILLPSLSFPIQFTPAWRWDSSYILNRYCQKYWIRLSSWLKVNSSFFFKFTNSFIWGKVCSNFSCKLSNYTWCEHRRDEPSHTIRKSSSRSNENTYIADQNKNINLTKTSIIK